MQRSEIGENSAPGRGGRKVKGETRSQGSQGDESRDGLRILWWTVASLGLGFTESSCRLSERWTEGWEGSRPGWDPVGEFGLIPQESAGPGSCYW